MVIFHNLPKIPAVFLQILSHYKHEGYLPPHENECPSLQKAFHKTVRIEMTGYVRIKALGHQKKVIFILQGDPDAVSQVVSAQVFPHDAEPGEDIIDISHNNNSFFMVHCNHNKTKSGNMQENFTRKKEKYKISSKNIVLWKWTPCKRSRAKVSE